MNFAVTGGAGFIGSHLVERLCSDGHDVTVIDNLSRGMISNLRGFHDAVDFVNMDIRKYGALKEVMRGADGIFHQAALAYVPGSYDSLDEYRQVNVVGAQNVFRIGLEHGIKTVYASSSTVYGDARDVPVREDSQRRPINPYGVTKLEAEVVAEEYMGRGARIIGLRYFNVVGLGRRRAYTGVVPRFLERIRQERPPIIHGDGSQAKDFVHVDDVVRANLLAMRSDVREGFFNIGSGRPISVADLARLMIDISGKALKPEYGDPRRGDARMCIADISKAAELLGWGPGTTLEEELSHLLRIPEPPSTQ